SGRSMSSPAALKREHAHGMSLRTPVTTVTPRSAATWVASRRASSKSANNQDDLRPGVMTRKQRGSLTAGSTRTAAARCRDDGKRSSLFTGLHLTATHGAQIADAHPHPTGAQLDRRISPADGAFRDAAMEFRNLLSG